MNMHASTNAVRAERLEIVTDGARLAAIAEDWTQLWQRADGLVFQSHAWIEAWWRTVPDRSKRTLRVGLVWNGDRLEAVMPLATHRRRGLVFLEWAANSHSDYEDILAATDCPPEALQRLWAKLAAIGGYDVALLNRMLPGAKAREVVTVAGLRLGLDRREEVSHRVAGPFPTGAAWFESQSKKTRQNHRRGQKFLEEAGRLEFRLLAPEEPLGPVLDRLAALKRKWLAARGHQSQLFNEGDPALTALVDALARAGVLRVFVLECDGVMVAVSINFIQGDTMMAFVTTYDPDHERASPGMVLMMDYIVWAFDHGLRMVDFLCGAEAFKLRFATDKAVLATFIGAKSLKGRVALLADRAKFAAESYRARRAAAKTPATDAAEA